MTKTQVTAILTPLDLNNITQPFDLATALKYMTENGEVIRGMTNGQKFYLYKETKQIPVFVGGRRQFKTIETITGAYEWGGGVPLTINVADLLNVDYTIMLFDEQGNPIWTDEIPAVDTGSEVVK